MEQAASRGCAKILMQSVCLSSKKLSFAKLRTSLYGKLDYRMAKKVFFPLCSSFFTLLLYIKVQVKTCSC